MTWKGIWLVFDENNTICANFTFTDNVLVETFFSQRKYVFVNAISEQVEKTRYQP